MKTATTNTTIQSPIHNDERRRLLLALDFLENNWRGVIGQTLDGAARVASMSRFHFHRRFHKCCGKTPKEIVTNKQINEAKRLILAGVALADVAEQCGFAHQSHMTSRFKQLVGLTPTRWKRQQQQEGAP